MSLTQLELDTLDLLSEAANKMQAICHPVNVDREPLFDPEIADGDWTEIAAILHQLQSRIMQQAAARAHPERFRLLGRKGAWM